MRLTPSFPVYIPSKGRWDTLYTMRSLDELCVPFRVVVEEDEFALYAERLGRDRLLVIDKSYFRDFDPCDDLGLSKPLGVGPARNFILDHARSEHSGWHWMFDDNIRYFYRFNANRKIRVADGTILRVMEDFVQRYSNVPLAGPNYFMFVKKRFRIPPYILNTRIYSAILLNNDVPFRWRARYNDDTDFSLRVLKAGFCTVLFNAFLAGKLRTQTVRGGLTDDIYLREGTVAKSTMLKRLHPDVVQTIMRFEREHHWIDYKRTFAQKLIRRDNVEIAHGINDYGMTLRQTNGSERVQV